MGWTAEDIPDQRDRVVVVTGGTSGLGLESARALARRGAHVVLAARDPERGEQARREVGEVAAGGARVGFVPLDLAALASVGACAERLLAEHGRIDVLLANAGVMGVPERETADGFELQLGVNHLGHFVLARRLLPALLRAPAGRVVWVSSWARLVGRPVDPANPHLRGRYDPWRAYGQAKLANVHCGIELQRRLDAAGASVRSLVVNPGLSRTDLQARSVRETGGGWSQRFFHGLAGAIGMPPERAALSQLRAATDPDARGGQMYGPLLGVVGPPVRRQLFAQALNRRAARVLWEVSERETGERFDVAEIVREAA